MSTVLQSLNNRADKIVTIRGEGVFHVTQLNGDDPRFDLWVGKAEDTAPITVAWDLDEDECRTVMNAIDRVLSELGR